MCALGGPGIVVWPRGRGREPEQRLRTLERLGEDDLLLKRALDDARTVTLSSASRSRTASARPIWDVGVLMTMDMDELPVANPQRAE
jgi:hypothetical protein